MTELLKEEKEEKRTLMTELLIRGETGLLEEPPWVKDWFITRRRVPPGAHN